MLQLNVLNNLNSQTYLTKPTVRIGIIGNGTDKFNTYQIPRVKAIIRDLFRIYAPCILVSGRSPRGGVDQWSEEIAIELGIPTDIKAPKCDFCKVPFQYKGMPLCIDNHQHHFSWPGKYGFKKRNIDIAKSSTIVFNILSNEYPLTFKGWKSVYCKHCGKDAHHVQSGACWTSYKAVEFGHQARWLVVAERHVP